ncbi:MAG: hypothetical protein O3C70_01315 [Actinomycetota bacterium]|nr:hypothetical protein [Actinomycetota bacterium]
MTVSDARRLQVYEQAREHWGEGPAEALMELIVPAGQDMTTKADIAEAVSSMKEYTLRMLLVTQIPIYLGIIGLYFTG